MLEAYLRPIYQYYLVNPVARYTQKISPGLITYMACLVGVLVAPLLVLHHVKLATLFLLLSGFLDTLDGSVARLSGKTSMLGSVFDIMSDRVVELAVILGLFAMDPSHRGWLTLVMLGSCYLWVSSFLVIGIFTPQNDTSLQTRPGLIERAEAFVFFVLMMALPSYFSILASLFTALVLLTSYLHLKEFIHYKLMHQ